MKDTTEEYTRCISSLNTLKAMKKERKKYRSHGFLISKITLKIKKMGFMIEEVWIAAIPFTQEGCIVVEWEIEESTWN